MKIVILDGYTENPGDLSWAPVEALGALTVYDRTDIRDEALIRQRIGDAEIVLTNKTPLSRETIMAAPALRFIGLFDTVVAVSGGCVTVSRFLDGMPEEQQAQM